MRSESPDNELQIKTWRYFLVVEVLLPAVFLLVVALLGSEILEGTYELPCAVVDRT